MNPKNSKKSPIHENADANITCDFGDGDISRSRSFLSNTYRRERPRPHARTRQSRGLLKFISRFILICFLWISWHYRDFWWNIDPSKTKKKMPLLNLASECSPGVSLGQFVQPVSIPRFICIICATFILNRSSRLTTFPIWIVDSLKKPKCRRGVSWGELFLAYVHSQMNPQTCTKFGANRSSRLAAFPDFILWPPKTPEMPPEVLTGELYLVHVHSQTNPHTCTKCGANRSSRLTASQDFWVCDSLNPTPRKFPLGYWGANCICICQFPE